MDHNFFAMRARMKYINRWALMRNTQTENLGEHSNDVAAIAHAIATLHNLRFGGNVNADRAAVLGLYHDMPEIITGDMPTPVKYHDETLRQAFQAVEVQACETLLAMLPDDLRGVYRSCFFHADADAELWKIVKAADKIAALMKCIEEQKAGNTEFDRALAATRQSIDAMDLPAAAAFLQEFLGGFYLSLDEQNA
ncbi:MAG: 5'-deoxynucleotidase [Clostridia bacterium]|nr:5'-deoxynucleotidase [Clostridia bacterium]MBR3553920.1 5'-deoxynucleotidase [Clostridia bacterium]